MDEVIEADPLATLGEHIAQELGGAVLAQEIAFGELSLIVDRAAIVDVISFLRDDAQCRFINFVDLCAVDYPDRDLRFEIVYHLLSPQMNQRIRVKLAADDVEPVPSLVSVFPAADWFEREAYDLYGVLFTGHPDLRRILTDYGFDGHPLRKDFPTTGFVEVRYDEERARVVYEPVRLGQEFRTFDYLSPWEGTDYVLPGDEKAKQ